MSRFIAAADVDMTPLCTIRCYTVFWRDARGKWRMRAYESDKRLAAELRAEAHNTVVIASDVVVPACVERPEGEAPRG